ncbi:MAG: hypothetical protein HRT70_01290 [Flavobacteriaceae bacterium]|nr:hypothetical protein [Flavobacteriaceae bacterium]
MKQYLYNLGVSLSQLWSVILGGHPDQSISQRTAKAYLAKPDGWFKYQRAFIDWILYLLLKEENHCLNSLKGESRAKSLWDWSKL